MECIIVCNVQGGPQLTLLVVPYTGKTPNSRCKVNYVPPCSVVELWIMLELLVNNDIICSII